MEFLRACVLAELTVGVGVTWRVTFGPLTYLLPLFCEDTGLCKSIPFIFLTQSKIALARTTMNTSFDSDISKDRENIDPFSSSSQSRRLMSGSLQILGNLTHKSNEHILNAIMRQADRQGLQDTIGYPNRTIWIRNNIPLWFGTGGILAG